MVGVVVNVAFEKSELGIVKRGFACRPSVDFVFLDLESDVASGFDPGAEIGIKEIGYAGLLNSGP